jgi:hypothetical protein
MSKVTVTADKNGNIVKISENNPEFGFIRVEQIATQIANGWLRQVKRSAIINGNVNDLLEAKFKDGQELPGKIVVIESFNAFNPENPDRDLKIAGDTGIICRVDDQPIYRQSVYTVNDQAQDEFIMHDNTDEIKEVVTIQKSLVKAKPVEEKEPAIQL